MDLSRLAETLMRMDDSVWQRHANPLSVWSRFTTLPLLALAIWSRVWLGWGSLVPIGAALVWIWANPRIFPIPRDFGGWPGRVVQGEQIWINRKHHGIPAHHLRAGHVTSALALPGAVILGFGLWHLNPVATLSGTLLTMLPKIWFCDRMVWLHADLTGIPAGTPMPKPVLPPGDS